MRLTKETKVGLLAIFTFIVLYWGFNYLKGRSIFDKTNIYYALYNNAEGLSTANQVRLNGYAVGRIQEVRILANEDYKIRVTLQIDKKIKLTDKTVASLGSSGLLDGKSINLLLREGKELQNKDNLLTEIAPTITEQFSREAIPAIQEVKSVTLLTVKFMQNLVENTNRINAIFHNLEKTSQQLHHLLTNNQADLQILSRNITNISETFSGAFSDEEIGIRPLLTKLKVVMEEIEKLQIGDLSDKANNILTKIENNTLEQVDQTLTDLDKLLNDVRRNPKKYVHFSLFGSDSVFGHHKKEVRQEKK